MNSILYYEIEKQQKKELLHSLFLSNKEKRKRAKILKSKATKTIKIQNKTTTIYFNKIDKTVTSFNFKVDYFKYYIELYIVEYLRAYKANLQNKL